MKQKIPVFWGCTLTHNYPFLVESTKKALEILDIDAAEIKDFGCCPDPVYTKAYGEDMHKALCARNLGLAEKSAEQLIVVCNGCYSVLGEAQRKLSVSKERDTVNDLLDKDKQYKGNLDVLHILKLLTKKLPIIKTKIETPLKGLKVAVHYGCHILYPPAVDGDDPKNPTSLEDIIRATGATPVNYESRLDCCGTPVAAFDKDEADRLLEKKLDDIGGNADCIVTTCPACFMRFDMPPANLKEKKVPVLHLSELLCLAFGIPIDALFLEGHMVKLDDVIKKLGVSDCDIKEITEKIREEGIDLHCGACTKECTAAQITKGTETEFDPLNVVEKLLSGRYLEVLEGEDIWQCLQCGKCEEGCPNNIGLKNLFRTLREISMARGKTPRAVSDKVDLIEKTGYAMPKRTGVRKRMNIDPAPEPDIQDIQSIMNRLKRREK